MESKFKDTMKKYKWIILIIILLICSLVGLFVLNNNKQQTQINSTVNELPLKIDTTPLSFNIVTKEQGPVLEATYQNNSKETISRLTIEVLLKDTGETIQMNSNETIEPGKTSNIFTGKAPASGNINDVEVLKYKILLSRGVYMEYDVKSKQYNWS